MALRWPMLFLTLVGCGKAAGLADAGACERFERACSVAGDCAVLNHQIDCRGSQRVIGIAKTSADAAQKQEDACVAAGPFCRCASRGPIAEDGKEILDAASLGLACTAEKCTTFVR